MGQSANATRLLGRGFHLVRVATATCVLGAILVLGAAAVSPSSARASLCGISSNVHANVHNDTGVTLNLIKASHGVTNAWCTFPTSALEPHSVSGFYAGDNVFETEVNASYEAPNHDVISLFAASRFFGRVEGSCSVSGPPASTYRCDARVSHNEREGGQNTEADFTITRREAGARHP